MMSNYNAKNKSISRNHKRKTFQSFNKYNNMPMSNGKNQLMSRPEDEFNSGKNNDITFLSDLFMPKNSSIVNTSQLQPHSTLNNIIFTNDHLTCRLNYQFIKYVNHFQLRLSHLNTSGGNLIGMSCQLQSGDTYQGSIKPDGLRVLNKNCSFYQEGHIKALGFTDKSPYFELRYYIDGEHREKYQLLIKLPVSLVITMKRSLINTFKTSSKISPKKKLGINFDEYSIPSKPSTRKERVSLPQRTQRPQEIRPKPVKAKPEIQYKNFINNGTFSNNSHFDYNNKYKYHTTSSQTITQTFHSQHQGDYNNVFE